MSSMFCGDHQHAIVWYRGGLGMQQFKTRRELAEHAIRAVCWEMNDDVRLQWLRRQAEELEAEIMAEAEEEAKRQKKGARA